MRCRTRDGVADRSLEDRYGSAPRASTVPRARVSRGVGARASVGQPALLAALLLVALFGQAAAQAPAGGKLRVELNGRAVDLRVARHRAYPAINGIELARGLLADGTVAAQTMRARLGGRELVFEAGSPFFRLGEATYQLANAPYEWGGAFWIPSDFLTQWWPSAVGSSGRLAGAGPADLAVPITSRPRRDPSRPMRVIIDPGHGGKDPGTLAQGVREKDVVLGIGRALVRALEARGGFEPSLTPDRDVFIPIQDRSRIAVRRDGELFVSIHVNSAPGRGGTRANGFETYFLGLERSEEAREVALRENSVIQYENGGGAGIENDLQFILTGLDRNENTVESRRFAGCVQNAISSSRPLHRRDGSLSQ